MNLGSLIPASTNYILLTPKIINILHIKIKFINFHFGRRILIFAIIWSIAPTKNPFFKQKQKSSTSDVQTTLIITRNTETTRRATAMQTIHYSAALK